MSTHVHWIMLTDPSLILVISLVDVKVSSSMYIFQSELFMFSPGRTRTSRSQPSLDDLHRRRKELRVQLEERKVISPPPFAASPTLPFTLVPHDYPREVSPERTSSCPSWFMNILLNIALFHLWILNACRYLEDGSKAYGSREPDYAGQYSPWSCDTIGSYIGSKDAKSKDVSSAVEMMASDLSSALCSHTSTKTVKNRGLFVASFLYSSMTECGGDSSPWTSIGHSAALCGSQRRRSHHSLWSSAHCVSFWCHFTYL